MARHIIIQEKVDCCGCSACYAVCPTGCIVMCYDEEGFKYPEIDGVACIDCGKCAVVCPLTQENCRTGAEPVKMAFAANNRDNDIRALSTSGGVFDAMARMVLDEGGVVVGARFDEGFHVTHAIADTPNEVSAFYGSKYVQSDLTDAKIYVRVREVCKAGTPVLFSGTPCQAHGLRMFLGHDYPGLLVCDFICRAVPSPLVWEGHLKAMEEKTGSRATEVVFRNKTYGYHSGTMKVAFEDGSVYYGSGRVDPMHKAFFADVISRPSCYRCRFRSADRSSDFTIFDCWSYSQLTGLEDDDLGHSHLWVHTEKGLRALDALTSHLELVEVDFEGVLSGDGVMATRNIKMNSTRGEFMAKCMTDGLEAAVTTYMPVSKKDLAIEKCKGGLHRIGVLSALSKAKRSMRMK